MAISRSQFVTATAAAVSSLSAVFSSAITVGNAVIIVSARWTNLNSLFSTVVDNKHTDGYTRRILSTMSNAADTSATVMIHDNLSISSGAGGSTFRVEVRNAGGGSTANAQWSLCALEYSGGPFTFGSTASANGTSTGPLPGTLTGSSTPVLFISGAIHNSNGSLFNSTTLGQAAYVTTVDPTNANQVVNVVQSTGSSLAQNIAHSMNASTRWLAGAVVYMGQGSGGATARPFVDGFPLFGCV